MNLVEAVELLFLVEFIKIERQGRSVGHGPEAASCPFEVDAHISEDDLVALPHRAADVAALVFVELGEFLGRYLDVELWNDALLEEQFVRSVCGLGRVGGKRRQKNQQTGQEQPHVNLGYSVFLCLPIRLK